MFCMVQLMSGKISPSASRNNFDCFGQALLTLYWPCIDPILTLYWPCIDPVLTTLIALARHWSHCLWWWVARTGTLWCTRLGRSLHLVHRSVGPVLTLYWPWIDPGLTLDWPCIDPVLTLCWPQAARVFFCGFCFRISSFWTCLLRSFWRISHCRTSRRSNFRWRMTPEWPLENNDQNNKIRVRDTDTETEPVMICE